MKIVQFKGAYPNFGDDLNTWLWPKLLPGFFDEDDHLSFIGIGSTLGDTESDSGAGKKIVFGAGFVPQYHSRPDVKGDDWHVYFVRGPRTAARLNLEPELALSDSGILLRTMVDTTRKTGEVISFMPHWESMERGDWEAVCAQAGINLIDPRRPVIKVIDELLRSKIVIAEAMHGAIISDAFRIPWVPVLPLNSAHQDKWYDWSESLDMTLRPHRLWPSQLDEFSASAFMKPKQPLPLEEVCTDMAYDAEVEDVPRGPTKLARIKRIIAATPVAPWVDSKLVDLAAYRLTRLAQVEPMMSDDSVINRATARMQEKVCQLQRDYAVA